VSVGPSLAQIALAYKRNKPGLISYLKDERDAIVDPDQAILMWPQLQITKQLSEEELNALASYLLQE